MCACVSVSAFCLYVRVCMFVSACAYLVYVRVFVRKSACGMMLTHSLTPFVS